MEYNCRGVYPSNSFIMKLIQIHFNSYKIDIHFYVENYLIIMFSRKVYLLEILLKHYRNKNRKAVD